MIDPGKPKYPIPSEAAAIISALTRSPATPHQKTNPGKPKGKKMGPRKLPRGSTPE
jgi:hypothetical protein